MSLVTYTNYTSYKPVANLNAKVNRLVKKTKKVEENQNLSFSPETHTSVSNFLSQHLTFKKKQIKIKEIMERRTQRMRSQFVIMMNIHFMQLKQYCAENDLEFDYDEHKALVDEATEIINIFKKHLT